MTRFTKSTFPLPLINYSEPETLWGYAYNERALDEAIMQIDSEQVTKVTIGGRATRIDSEILEL